MIVKINGVEQTKIETCMDNLNSHDQITELACQGWAIEHDFMSDLFDFLSNFIS